MVRGMARQPRIHLPGLPLHIVQRGHNRQACFFAVGDYLRYLHWLGEALRATRIKLHAYVLMTNHVHLLLTPQDASAVPLAMISLGRRYVQSVNKRYARTGTLWDSRYHASIVCSDSHLLACQRYIELNPVRAGMVCEPAQYRWSSFRCNALGKSDKLISAHPTYGELGRSDAARRREYRQLFERGHDATVAAEIRLAVNQNQPLGPMSFQVAISDLAGSDRRVRPRGRPRVSRDLPKFDDAQAPDWP